MPPLGCQSLRERHNQSPRLIAATTPALRPKSELLLQQTVLDIGLLYIMEDTLALKSSRFTLYIYVYIYIDRCLYIYIYALYIHMYNFSFDVA